MMFTSCIATFATIFALAASAPIRPTSSPGLATVDLRIVGPQSTHYTTDYQSPTSDQSQHLTVIVGQTLLLDHDPLHIQGLEIVTVKAGASSTLLPVGIEKNDQRVTCSVCIDGREDEFEFDMKDKGVLLAGGRLVKVTRLDCAVIEGAAW